MSERQIWKYEIWADRTTVELPRGAEILTVQVQDDLPVIWALVDPKQPRERHDLFVVGTGCDVPDGLRYIGTWQRLGLVWHLFEPARQG